MGRKKLGNELFARRLSKEQIAAVEALLAGDRVSVAPEPQKAPEGLGMPVMGQSRDNDVRQLLDSIGSMEQEILELKGSLEEARSTNLDANGAYWKGMYVQLKTQVMKNNELSQ